MNGSVLLMFAGAGLLAMALGIIRKQARAAHCARHDARVGALAMVLAAACLVCGLVLIQVGLVG